MPNKWLRVSAQRNENQRQINRPQNKNSMCWEAQGCMKIDDITTYTDSKMFISQNPWILTDIHGASWMNAKKKLRIWIKPWATTAMVGQQMERRPAIWARESVRDRARNSGLLLPTTACAISKKLHMKVDRQHWYSNWEQTPKWPRIYTWRVVNSKIEGECALIQAWAHWKMNRQHLTDEVQTW